jgi:type I restriction enzyme R subunit
LRIATIFTYGSNEDSDEANDSLPDDEQEYDWAAEPRATYKSSHSRDKLESYIGDYNTCMERVLRPRIVNRFKIFPKYQQAIKREKRKVSTMRKTD